MRWLTASFRSMVVRKGQPVVCALAVVSLAVATPAAAQQRESSESARRSVRLGIRAGVSQTTLKSANPFDDFTWRRALTAGMFLDRWLTDRFGVRLDVTVLRMGGTNRQTRDRSTHFDFWRLAIPVSGTMRLFSGGKVQSALIGGMAPGFRLHGVLDRSDSGTQDVTSDTSFMSMSLIGGASIDIGRLRMDFQYLHGLKSQTAVSRLLNFSMHDRTALIALGFSIR